MKIIAEQKLRGQKFNLPTVGITDIPEDGILDLEETLAKSLVESKIGYDYVDKKLKAKEVKPADDEVAKLSEKSLEALTLEELINLAEQAELPKEEWEKFSINTKKPKELMIIYLGKKLK